MSKLDKLYGGLMLAREVAGIPVQMWKTGKGRVFELKKVEKRKEEITRSIKKVVGDPLAKVEWEVVKEGGDFQCDYIDYRINVVTSAGEECLFYVTEKEWQDINWGTTFHVEIDVDGLDERYKVGSLHGVTYKNLEDMARMESKLQEHLGGIWEGIDVKEVKWRKVEARIRSFLDWKKEDYENGTSPVKGLDVDIVNHPYEEHKVCIADTEKSRVGIVQYIEEKLGVQDVKLSDISTSNYKGYIAGFTIKFQL